MLARRARKRLQYARGNIRFGDFVAYDHFAVWPGYRQTLKVGQFAFAQMAFEVIANQAIPLAHIQDLSKGLAPASFPRLSFEAPTSASGLAVPVHVTTTAVNTAVEYRIAFDTSAMS